jgi:predicted DNA-binding protein (MmcQ/YjbR family)
MTLEELQDICKKFPGVTQDIKWENHLCFNVGEKMFMITSPDSVPVTASFKTGDEDFEALSAREGMKPAPYLARYKWIFVDDIKRLSRKEWERYLFEAYQIIASKLPLKIKKQLKVQLK